MLSFQEFLPVLHPWPGVLGLLWVYGLIWVGRDLKDHLIPSPAILSASSRYCKPCPAWPWTCPGMGQSQFP